MHPGVFFVGLCGGILAANALNYPLYQYLPAPFVEGWQRADTTTALVWLLIAAVVLVATGAVAARLSGTRSRAGAVVAGGIAGLIATIIAEMWLGGAAAGVWGSHELLAHSVTITRDDSEFLGLLAEAVVSTVWWTYASLWIAIAIGLVLGALGGIVAGPGGPLYTLPPMLLPTLAVIGILVSCLGLVVSLSIFGLLAPQTQDAADRASRALTFPAGTIWGWVAATGFALLIVWQLFGWWSIRRERTITATDHTILVRVLYAIGLLPFAWVALLLGIVRGTSFPALVILGMFVSLGVGIITLKLARTIRSLPKLPAVGRPLDPSFFALVIALGGGILFATVYFIVAPSLNLVLLVVPPIATLSLHDPSAVPFPSAITSLQDVQVLYEVHSGIFYSGMQVTVMATVVVTAITWIIRRWQDRQRTN